MAPKLSRYTDRDGEVYEAESAYPITFSQFGVELTWCSQTYGYL